MAGGISQSGDDHWGQDRRLMKHGNHTGFNEIVIEDFVTQVSMGPIVNRADEYLCPADQAIVRMRRHLMQALKCFENGDTPVSARLDARDYSCITATGGVMKSVDDDWRALPR